MKKKLVVVQYNAVLAVDVTDLRQLACSLQLQANAILS
jgi:hypothetical protein